MIGLRLVLGMPMGLVGSLVSRSDRGHFQAEALRASRGGIAYTLSFPLNDIRHHFEWGPLIHPGSLVRRKHGADPRDPLDT